MKLDGEQPMGLPAGWHTGYGWQYGLIPLSARRRPGRGETSGPRGSANGFPDRMGDRGFWTCICRVA